MFSPPLKRGPIPHGTPSGFRFHGCKCEGCRKANALAMQASRKYRRAHGICAFGSHPSRPGKSTCTKCGAAQSAKQMVRYYKAKQQKAEAA